MEKVYINLKMAIITKEILLMGNIMEKVNIYGVMV